MRVLITGAQGQLGTDVARECNAAGDHVTALTRGALDITDLAAVREAATAIRPDAIINCAAWTAVDACEADPNRADAINHQAVGFLADTSDSVNAHLVHISTDYVFDGTKQAPYTEQDVTNPQSVYGKSKLAGEIAAGAAASVVRTSWVCSAHGGNMLATIIRLEREHPELAFVADQRGNPTFTADLAPALRQLAIDRHSGILHLTNAGTVSWHEFAQAVLEEIGADPDRVKPVATADLRPARPAPRPANSALSNELFASLGYAPLRPFRDALTEAARYYL